MKHNSILSTYTVGTSYMNHVRQTSNAEVHFGMVPVRVLGSSETIETYGFLDSGFDNSLKSEDLMRHIGIEGTIFTLKVTANGASSHVFKEVE